MNHKPYVGQFDQLPLSLVQEQLSFLHRHSFVHFWLNTLSATLLCALLWMKAPTEHILLVVWYIALLGLAAGRWWSSQYFSPKHTLTYEKLQNHVQHFRFLSLSLCALWGISAVILFYDDALLTTLHIVILAIISVSMLPFLVISRVDYYLQLAVLLLPCLFTLLLLGGLQTHLLAIILMVFAGTLLLTAYVIEQLLNRLFNIQQSLLEQIHTDPVTQLVNRSHFDALFKTEWRRAARQHQPLSLLLIEIDNFQVIEASQGTNVSDQYLRVLTHCIKTVARRGSDILARYGRSEFIVLLPDTSIEHALLLANRLRDEVNAADLGIQDKAGKEYFASISIGVSTCTPKVYFSSHEREEGQLDEVLYPAMLLSAAGRALHRAKQAPDNIAHETCQGNEGEVTVFRTQTRAPA